MECIISVVLFTIFCSMATGESCEETCGELGTLIYEKTEASDVQKSLTRHQLSEASVVQTAFFHKTTAVVEQLAYRLPSHNNSTVVCNSGNVAAVIVAVKIVTGQLH